MKKIRKALSKLKESFKKRKFGIIVQDSTTGYYRSEFGKTKLEDRNSILESFQTKDGETAMEVWFLEGVYDENRFLNRVVCLNRSYTRRKAANIPFVRKTEADPAESD